MTTLAAEFARYKLMCLPLEKTHTLEVAWRAFVAGASTTVGTLYESDHEKFKLFLDDVHKEVEAICEQESHN